MRPAACPPGAPLTPWAYAATDVGLSPLPSFGSNPVAGTPPAPPLKPPPPNPPVAAVPPPNETSGLPGCGFFGLFVTTGATPSGTISQLVYGVVMPYFFA